MIKRFCDACGSELYRNVVSDRIKESSVVHNTDVGFEITVSVGGVWNGGDLCKNCLLRAIDKIDDRPRQGHD